MEDNKLVCKSDYEQAKQRGMSLKGKGQASVRWISVLLPPPLAVVVLVSVRALFCVAVGYTGLFDSFFFLFVYEQFP